MPYVISDWIRVPEPNAHIGIKIVLSDIQITIKQYFGNIHIQQRIPRQDRTTQQLQVVLSASEELGQYRLTYQSEETFLISVPKSSFHQLHKESCIGKNQTRPAIALKAQTSKQRSRQGRKLSKPLAALHLLKPCQNPKTILFRWFRQSLNNNQTCKVKTNRNGVFTAILIIL